MPVETSSRCPAPVPRLGAVEIDTGVAVVGTRAGKREVAVQTNYRETAGHEAKDYPWPRVWFAGRHANRAVPGTIGCRGGGGRSVSGYQPCWPPRSTWVRNLPDWLPTQCWLRSPSARCCGWAASRCRSSAPAATSKVGRPGAPAGIGGDPIAAVPRSAKSAALGRQLDPAAFVLHRNWVGPMVLLVLDDPDDPTPYWLASSRHPDRVLSALRS